MGAYDSNPSAEATSYGRDARASWDRAQMDGGVGVDNLADRFDGMDLGGNSKESIIQVMKAVDAAENTIKLQLEENNRLKEELKRRTEELKNYKSDAEKADARDEHVGSSKAYIPPVEVAAERNQWVENNSSHDPSGTLVIHQNGILKNEISSFQNSAGIQQYSDNRGNGSVKTPPSRQANSYNPGVSQFSPPSSRSISPSRHKKEADYDPVSSSACGRLPTPEIHSSSSTWKHDLILKIKEHEEEILQLRRHLADYSMKEAQIRNEKYVLEKRIAHMRMAFDQQQQDLVDAASKALSYRQDIIEENIRLTYALQSAQQERSTFVSSLLPLLSEYGLQPQTSDALSIVSNLKILFRHLHEKLIITEEKLKESQYQIAPWHAEASNNSKVAPQSPSHSFGVIKNGFEIVPLPPYSHAHSPTASPLNAQTRADWEALGHQTLQTSHGFASKNLGHDNMGRSSPSASRNATAEDLPPGAAVAQEESRMVHFSPETKEQSLSFKDLAGRNEMDDSEAGPLQAAGESSTQWDTTSSPYLASGLDPNSSFPYLPPVLEEPSSSFSEAADDDPLPAIEGLQISGEAYPGRELQAAGYSINGTTACIFEWVHYLEDGSVNCIEGAKQPNYLVTADDVGFYLAIQVQPLDDRKRKGELVEVYANEQRKISCDPEMQEQIERIYSTGHASFEVSISAGVLNIWEHAVLAIKTEGYSIRCDGPRGVVVAEKFSPTMEIMIPYGQLTEFSIQSAGGGEHLLRTNNSSLPRDTIVLTMRLFKMRAVEKRKSKRKGRFF